MGEARPPLCLALVRMVIEKALWTVPGPQQACGPFVCSDITQSLKEGLESGGMRACPWVAMSLFPALGHYAPVPVP